MEKQGYGRIVFCSSIAAGKPFSAIWTDSRDNGSMRVATGGVLGPHYSSSKAAIHGLMHWIARQYSKKGIVGIVISVRYAMLSWFAMSDLQCRCPGPNRQHGHVQ
jgi:NAD(P)-dependent dehydrogenase (short-subunit alcohol dehydrogenase family)